jgi:hypothetical protein
MIGETPMTLAYMGKNLVAPHGPFLKHSLAF